MSKIICNGCHQKLSSFYYFKQELITKQAKLYELLEEQKITTEIEALHENASIGYDEPKNEPFVNIKTESEVEEFRISEVFESIDYDVGSGE